MFGMIESNSRKVKMFYVEDRSAETLIPLLRAHVHPDSTIWSDEWRAYGTLGEYFRKHETIKHEINFVDPNTGANTQLIECVWSHTKLKILRNSRGTTLTLLQSHLSFFCFCYRYKFDDAFQVFMKLIK